MDIEDWWNKDAPADVYRCLYQTACKCIEEREAQLHDACFKRDGFKAEFDMQDARIAELEDALSRRGGMLRTAIEVVRALDAEVGNEHSANFITRADAELAKDVECVDDPGRKFKRGQRVRKRKGSSWHGHVVGFYRTELTPYGYAVESEREPGSVQIYPGSALEAVDGDFHRPTKDQVGQNDE